jgi:hypothetical protein
MEIRYKITNNDGLAKLLYSDNSDEKQRNYLNINLLRYLKNYLLQSMTQKERGCINLYHLENYLIERALDPMTEEIYKNGEELIHDTLNYLRSRHDYWIKNSEVYLEIVNKGFNPEDDKYVNKDLIAVYNYIYQSEIREDRSHMIVDATTDPDFDVIDLLDDKTVLNNPDYLEFVELLQSNDYIAIDPAKRLVFDSTVVPLIFSYCVKNFGVNDNMVGTKLQNLILFFSYVGYHEELDILWNNTKEDKDILQTANSKKYNLRLSKLNEDEMDALYIQKQIKIFELQEKLSAVKNFHLVENFLSYLKANKVNIF